MVIYKVNASDDQHTVSGAEAFKMAHGLFTVLVPNGWVVTKHRINAEKLPRAWIGKSAWTFLPEEVEVLTTISEPLASLYE